MMAVKSFFVTLGLVTLLSACQTTGDSAGTTREVEPSDTVFDMPFKEFGFKKAKIYERGSFRIDTISFRSGYIRHYQYYRGGMLKPTRDKTKKRIHKLFPDANVPKEITFLTVPIGDIYYAVFNIENDTCLFFNGYRGDELQLQGGVGYDALTEGLYCSDKDSEFTLDKIKTTFKKIKIRS